MNLLRALVLLFGGGILGMGFPILVERARLWRHLGYPAGVRACGLLLLVNVEVLTFVTFALVAQWNHAISWRLPLALAIFLTKAAMLLNVRGATLQEEQRLAREGVIDRRQPQRQRRTEDQH